MSYIDKLKIEINDLKHLFDELLDSVTIEYHDPNANSRNTGVFIVTSLFHYWRDGSDPVKTKALQRKLKEKYINTKTAIEFLCKQETDKVVRDLNQLFERLENYIEQKTESCTPNSTKKAKENVQTWLNKINEVLKHIETACPETSTIIIPDTNALVVTTDPTQYRKLTNEDKFLFVITTPVLRELDSQKEDGRRRENYRERVKKAIKRIKGFRNQGNITEGITVDKTISVMMDYKEPNIKESFDWLDPDNNDDQVICRSLELQKQFPSSKVIIVTSDINLQNKAIGARLNYSEPPKLSTEQIET